MQLMILLLVVANITMGILLFVFNMAKLDQTYAAKVRAEHDRKSILRGERPDD